MLLSFFVVVLFLFFHCIHAIITIIYLFTSLFIDDFLFTGGE